MKKLFVFIILVLLSKPTVSQWVLDYQFNTAGSISVRGLSIADTSYIWISTVDSINNGNILKRINGSNTVLNNGGIDRPEKIISIDSSKAYVGSYGQYIYYTSNSGANWITKLSDSTLAYPYFNVSYTDPNVLIASTLSLDSGYTRVYITSNGGINWNRQNIIFPENSETYDVSVTNPQHFWVGVNCTAVNCPDMRYYFTTNAGINWQVKTFDLISNNVRMDAPVFKSNNNFGLVFSPGFNYYQYSSTDGGTNWSVPTLLISGDFYGVKLFNVDSTQTWYWATQKKIFKTTNDGLNWSEMSINLVDPEFIRAVSFKKIGNKFYGWVGTNTGKLFKISELISPIGIHPISTEIPKSYSLSQNYPNPFNPVTKIRFSLPHAGNVRLTVYDALGKEIKLLVNENLQAGIYETDFDAANIPSGVYFYRIEADGFTETKKMILLK